MLEDGYEFDNVFERNLGAHLKRPSRILVNIDHSIENDNGPAVFWIMSPMNHWSVSILILFTIFLLPLDWVPYYMVFYFYTFVHDTTLILHRCSFIG